MNYRNSQLFIENVSANKIIKKFGTPAYCYSFSQLKKNILSFKENFKNIKPLVCFAVKSNSNIRILKEISKFGLGADVVSKGELVAAIKSNINPKNSLFWSWKNI